MIENKGVTWIGTTILSVRKGKEVAIAGDNQITLGSVILKPNVRKVRRLGKGDIIAGCSASIADTVVLFEILESKIKQTPHQLNRSCVDLAKDWRKDPYLQSIDGMMAVVSESHSILVTSYGDVLEPEDGVIVIGAGGPYAFAAARALLDVKGLTAQMIVEKAMGVSSDICVSTNNSFIVETIEG